MVANQIAKTRYMTDGQVALPLVIRTANGAGLRFGAQHSQSVENWAMAIPGLKVVVPSNPADMIGLLAAAIRDPDPVIVCEHKALFAVKGEVPDGEHVTPLGEAAIVRSGGDVTIVALAAMVPRAVEAADAAGRRARDRRRGDRPPDPGPARRPGDPALGREDEPAVHGRGEPAASAAGERRSCPSSPTRASTASTHRSSGSRRRTSRCPRRRSLEDLAIPTVERIVATVKRRLDEAK